VKVAPAVLSAKVKIAPAEWAEFRVVQDDSQRRRSLQFRHALGHFHLTFLQTQYWLVYLVLSSRHLHLHPALMFDKISSLESFQILVSNALQLHVPRKEDLFLRLVTNCGQRMY
jgi:hypothetical protein